MSLRCVGFFWSTFGIFPFGMPILIQPRIVRTLRPGLAGLETNFETTPRRLFLRTRTRWLCTCVTNRLAPSIRRMWNPEDLEPWIAVDEIENSAKPSHRPAWIPTLGQLAQTFANSSSRCGNDQLCLRASYDGSPSRVVLKGHNASLLNLTRAYN